MRRTAYFYSLGRGNVVDEARSSRRSKRKRIGGAFLDVFEHEPLPGLIAALGGTAPAPPAARVRDRRDYLDLWLEELAPALDRCGTVRF